MSLSQVLITPSQILQLTLHRVGWGIWLDYPPLDSLPSHSLEIRHGDMRNTDDHQRSVSDDKIQITTYSDTETTALSRLTLPPIISDTLVIGLVQGDFYVERKEDFDKYIPNYKIWY